MSQPPKIEHMVGNNVAEITWLRFRRLASVNLCWKVVEERAPDLPPKLLALKAEGVASAARSAIGYWQTDAPTLSAKILTRYYALLQASIAEQVASSDSDATLSSVQRHTEQGHGLAVASYDPERGFPEEHYVCAMKQGHFASYAKSRSINVSAYAFERRPKWSKDEAEIRAKGISVADLLLRIPEIATIAEECLDRHALSFRVFAHEINVDGISLWRQDDSEPEPGARTKSVMGILVDPDRVTAEALASAELPFTNYRRHVSSSGANETYWIADLEHPRGEYSWQHFEHYKSDYCGTSVITPFWGCRDVFILHLATLYALSIVVRYLPSLWHRVEYGDLDHIRMLIEHYLSVFDHVGPSIALERITGTVLKVALPGTGSAPI